MRYEGALRSPIYDLCRQTVTVYHACYNPFRVTRCVRNKRARGKMLDKSEQEFARENAAVIKIHAAESVEDKAEKERLLDLLGR